MGSLSSRLFVSFGVNKTSEKSITKVIHENFYLSLCFIILRERRHIILYYIFKYSKRQVATNKMHLFDSFTQFGNIFLELII